MTTQLLERTPQGVDEPPRRHRPWAPVAVAALVALLLVPGTGWFGLRPVLALVLLGLPVLALAARLPWRTEDRVRPVLVSLGLVLLGVLVVGLAANTVLPVIGIDRPLDRPVAALLLGAASCGVLAWRRDVAVLPVPHGRPRLRLAERRVDLAVTVAVLAVALAVVGAVRLNNGEGGTAAITGRVLAVVAVALLLRHRGTRRRDAWTVYLVALALLLSTSLRGWYVVGHDIQQEFAVFSLAHDAGRWTVDAFPTAYNACLSLSILPTLVAGLTGLSGLVVFKVLVPLLFAVVPVTVLEISRAFGGRRLALLAATVFVAFPTFAVDMPYLVRQEVAFVLLALVVLVALHEDLGRRARLGLVIAFGAGVVVTHYSTTYLLLLGLLVSTVGLALERRRSGGESLRPVLATPVVLAALAAATVGWVGPVTHSGGHVGETVSDTVGSLLRGDLGIGSSDLAYGLFAGAQKTQQQRLDLYADHVAGQREDAGASGWLLRRPTAQDGRPVAIRQADQPLTPVGRALDAAGISAPKLDALLRLGSAALLQVWLLLGVVLLVLRRTRARTPREAVWLVVGAVAGVGILVLVPGLSADYGVLRAFQQALLLGAPVIVLAAVASVRWVLRRGSRGRTKARARRVVSVVVLLVTLALTGVFSALTGGAPGVMALASSGPYVDRFYTTPSEHAGYEWVSSTALQRHPAPVVTADGSTVDRLANASDLRLPLSRDFAPTLLRSGEWVFLDADNVHASQATVFYTGNVLTYRYPVDRLQRRMDVVWSSPDARVLR